MRIINKKILLIMLLVGVILTGVIVEKPNKKVKLDNVILKQEVNNKTFAMYKEDDENNYVLVKDNKFPDMYVLNLTESKCIDNNGNELDGVLSYENDKVTITSGNTTYCYLYFDKSLGLQIKEDNPKGLSEGIKGAMYRFQGQAKDENNNELVNNYICFGTNDQAQCTSDTDKYMYRIIGIEAETGRVKVIKKEALEQKYQWYTDNDKDIKLPESIFFKAINDTDFLNNQEYIPNGWKDKISDNIWMYGDMLDDDSVGAKQLGEELYKVETGQKETKWYVKSTEDTETEYKEQHGNWTNTIDSKISLMYLHDYSYSVGDEAKCNFYYHSETEFSKCKTGWIHLSQNDTTNPPSVHEWMMSRVGWSTNGSFFRGYTIHGDGYAHDWYLADSESVRPVFFIDASQTLKGGIGTITDPFIIQE